MYTVTVYFLVEVVTQIILGQYDWDRRHMCIHILLYVTWLQSAYHYMHSHRHIWRIYDILPLLSLFLCELLHKHSNNFSTNVSFVYYINILYILLQNLPGEDEHPTKCGKAMIWYLNPNPGGYINWRCRAARSHIWPPRQPTGEREALHHAAAVVGSMAPSLRKSLETMRAAQKLLGAPTIGGGRAWAGGGTGGSQRNQIRLHAAQKI